MLAVIIISIVGALSGLTSVCLCRAAKWADEVKQPDILTIMQ